MQSWGHGRDPHPHDAERIRRLKGEVAGEGPRLFEPGAAPSRLSLEASRSYANGVVHLSYRRA